MSLTAPEQPDTTGQDPAAAAVTPPAPTPPAPAGDSPWSPDLALLFEDEATRTKVDQYLRTKIQPHTTKLEQDLAAQREAVDLWKQLTDAPADAYADITTQLLGDAAQPVLDYIKQLQDQTPAAPEQPGQAPFDPMQDPRIAEIVQDFETRKAETYYDQEFSRILTTAVDLTDANPAVQESKQRLYHMCVNQEGGDFDKALELYRATVSPFGTSAPIVPDPVAPPALGSDAGGANPSAAPTVPPKQTLDEAINDFMNEQRASKQAPPVIG